MDIEKLNSIDFQILRYFRDHSPASIDDAHKALPDIDAIEYRISYMATYDTFTDIYIRRAVPNSSCLRLNRHIPSNPQTQETDLENLDTYSITTLGKKVLQDYETLQRQRRKDMWLESGKIPIIVTIIANLVISGIKWLLPLIQQWFSSSH